MSNSVLNPTTVLDPAAALDPAPRRNGVALPTVDGVFPAGCPSRTVLDHVCSKWGLLLLVSLAEGPQRWSALRRRAEGISEKMLAQTLKVLEADGFVHRQAYGSIPPRVDYSLTDRGAELVTHLLPLVAWISRRAEEILARPAEAPAGRE